MSVTRTTMILISALVLACGGTNGASGDETSGTTSGNVDGSSSSTGSSGPVCTPGTEGCACDDGSCEVELSCFSQVCVRLPADESSSSAVGTSTADSSSSEESSDDASSSSSEESSSTGPAVVPCEEEGNNVCHDGVLDTCARGEVLSQSCDDVCAQSGYESTGCGDINHCGCDGFIDATCETIAGKYCQCLAFYNGTCDDGDMEIAYDWCFDPRINPSYHESLLCLGGYPTDTYEECNIAVNACF
jgi:hypothetical protein